MAFSTRNTAAARSNSASTETEAPIGYINVKMRLSNGSMNLSPTGKGLPLYASNPLHKALAEKLGQDDAEIMKAFMAAIEVDFRPFAQKTGSELLF